ncbi:RND family efflux transporter, MFP subunit [Abditibacterium utsteinense]|uniref:RND family efflux transporter, MFP subunit n=1 Tax=Abditibacterium utsteinense TaxID=1960156 RepID=A0A2S8SPT3_9BACT|nr:efflux RND transporter periplasmic adaptor subunit [Abditibacterium utsteinense]PQV62801.1 RND family efflux transporter, MFP subunit [Abditibacterium utsteinense]
MPGFHPLEPQIGVSIPKILLSAPRFRPARTAIAPMLFIAFSAFLTGCRAPQNEVDVNKEAEQTTSPEEGTEKAQTAGESSISFDAKSLKLAGIELSPARRAPLQTGIAVNGQIAPNPSGVVRVASIVPGRVTRLFVAEGSQVRQGQTLAVIESRSIGEAQSAYGQAAARLQNARSNLNVIQQQAKAGVFARAPLETARRAQVDASADARAQETAVRGAKVALDNVLRLARTGSYASPALEAARAQAAAAREAVQSSQAALSNARAAIQSAQAELRQRQNLAASGAYVSRPVQEARRALVTAQSARAAAQSEVATTRANLARARSLSAEGLVSGRDLEAAQQAFDTATARLQAAQSDETTAAQELARQQKLAASGSAGTAEIGAARAQLAAAVSDVRTRSAEAERARSGLRLAQIALEREQAVFGQNIANRREVSTARGALETAQTALTKARQTLQVVSSAYGRETRIYRQNLNNIAQVQTARAAFVGAQADFGAAQTALSLLKSSPGGAASITVRAPISGVVQERSVTQGETVAADAALLTLVNTASVALEATLYEKDVASVRLGAPVRLTVDALPDRAFSGRISFIGARLDPETRTLTARALIPNAGELRPGMFARGQIGVGSGAAVLAVPKDAVQTMDGKPVVFVRGAKPDTFLAREITKGATADGLTQVKSGLKSGEMVVSQGAFIVKSQAMKSELGEEE